MYDICTFGPANNPCAYNYQNINSFPRAKNVFTGTLDFQAMTVAWKIPFRKSTELGTLQTNY